jgi:Zn-dependent protease with chaperone function
MPTKWPIDKALAYHRENLEISIMATYPGITSEAFQHPLDREAENTLRSVPGFDLVARKFVEFLYERPQIISLKGSSIQAGPRQYSTIYGIFRECVRDLDISPEPTLFISQNPQVNAYSLGQEFPYIVLNTGLLDLLDEQELRTVIAHELGHIKCGHTLLIQMAMWAMSIISNLGQWTFGVGNIISSGLVFAFYEWRRKAELSSDRAALLVMDDVNIVFSTMMKISGGSKRYMNECSLQEFIQQSKDFHDLDKDNLNQMYKVLMYTGVGGSMMSHPFAVDRVKYLQEWSESSEYATIRQGNYSRTSVEVNNDAPPSPPSNGNEREVDQLQRQIAELQKEISRWRDNDESK